MLFDTLPVMNAETSDSILLYRFMSSNAALKTIESRSFRVGRLKEFNDPFEWRMGITGIIPQGQEMAKLAMDRFIEDVDGWMGVFCFSASATEPVLWSHYADKHRGVAFELNHPIDPERLIKMEYTNERPIVDASRLFKPEEVNAYLLERLNKLMRQKSLGWSYEQEYRSFVDLVKDCDITGGDYFRRIPDKVVNKVILGFQSPLEEKYIRKALSKVGLGSAEVTRARMCLETYSVRFD
jgi:hypothetical protein